MYAVYEVVEYYFGEETKELLAVFNTSEEAETYEDKLVEIQEKYPINMILRYEIEEFENASLSTIEAEHRSEYEEDLKAKKGDYTETITALSDLKRARELFARFDFASDFSKEKFESIKLELWSVIKENNLPVSLFDEEYDYLPDGTKEEWSGRERITYAPIILSSNRYRYYYHFDNYDIDNDIENIERWVSDNEYLGN